MPATSYPKDIGGVYYNVVADTAADPVDATIGQHIEAQ